MLICPPPTCGKTDILLYEVFDINFRDFSVFMFTNLQCSSSKYKVLALFLYWLLFSTTCVLLHMFYWILEMWSNSPLVDALKKMFAASHMEMASSCLFWWVLFICIIFMFPFSLSLSHTHPHVYMSILITSLHNPLIVWPSQRLYGQVAYYWPIFRII